MRECCLWRARSAVLGRLCHDRRHDSSWNRRITSHIDNNTHVLRHGRFRVAGRTKNGKANGNSSTNGLGAVKDGLAAAKEIFPAIGRLEGNDRGTNGMNGGHGPGSRVGNRCQISRHGNVVVVVVVLGRAGCCL